MPHRRAVYLLILIAAVYSAHAFAQTKPFTPPGAEFSIELGTPEGNEAIAPVADTHSGGKHYTWGEGAYDAGFMNLLPGIVPSLYLDRVATGMISQATSGSGTLKYRKDVTLGDMAGVEFAIVLKGDGKEFVFLNRVYARKGRAYVLNTIWPASQTGAAQIKVLDSFKPDAPAKAETPAAPSGTFVSEAGRFSIGLPAKPDSESAPGPSQTTTFTWNLKDGATFTIAYIDTEAATRQEGADKLAAAATRFTESQTGAGNKLESRKDILVGTHRGVDIRFRLKEGLTAVTRYYMVDARFFVVTGAWIPGPDDKNLVAILDSFKVVTKPALPKGQFVSEGGGFSAALPGKPEETTDAEGYKTFTWWLSDTYVFSIGYIDSKATSKEDGLNRIKRAADSLAADFELKGTKLESRRDLTVGGHDAVEVRYRTKEGVLAITRYYMIVKRLFTVTTIWLPDGDDSFELEMLDSFKPLASAK